jgi:osmoprotectant transport system permease protein
MTGEIARATLQHVVIVLAAVSVAAAAGIPIGVLCVQHPRTGRVVLRLIDTVQTIPSLALFGFLIPLPLIGGIGIRTAIVALILYSLLPIVRNTVTGIAGIDPLIREAAMVVGMTERQRLMNVELPLALPSIFGGLRIATVIAIGVATIGAAIGGGGLGTLIFRGVAMVDSTRILAGALPAALLALIADLLFGALERAAARRFGSEERQKAEGRRQKSRPTLLTFCLLPSAFCLFSTCQARNTIVVGSKNFTESVLLGEIIAQRLERAGCTVDRKLDLGGTLVCDRAITSGSIDVYPEYSGTALTAILRRPTADITRAYAQRGLRWGPALGFENTFAMIVRRADADRLSLRRISDLAKVTATFRPGFGYEFVERPDGWTGLQQHYSLQFQQPPRTMDLGLTYRALAAGQVDLIAGNSTDGLIDALGLTILEDDRRFFPPYDAALVSRAEIARKCGEAPRALESLAGVLDGATMRRLNYAVDGQRRSPATVAGEFLEAKLP